SDVSVTGNTIVGDGSFIGISMACEGQTGAAGAIHRLLIANNVLGNVYHGLDIGSGTVSDDIIIQNNYIKSKFDPIHLYTVTGALTITDNTVYNYGGSGVNLTMIVVDTKAVTAAPVLIANNEFRVDSGNFCYVLRWDLAPLTTNWRTIATRQYDNHIYPS